jgi:hypothetical protein
MSLFTKCGEPWESRPVFITVGTGNLYSSMSIVHTFAVQFLSSIRKYKTGSLAGVNKKTYRES